MSTRASSSKKIVRREGLCKLTGRYGRYVNAHIYPRALTFIGEGGGKVLEMRVGGRVISRPPTWYDNQLVIREGENILEEIDTKGIESLRRNMLVWSAFSVDMPFAGHELLPLGPDFGYRRIAVGSANELRLFFISVVWRAAASDRPEFADVNLPPFITEDLRSRVLASDPGEAFDFPIILDQIVKRGVRLNRTPFVEELMIPTEAGEMAPAPCVRMYFDGLVAKCILGRMDSLWSAPNLVLGACPETWVAAREYEGSRTAEDADEVMLDNWRRGYRTP